MTVNLSKVVLDNEAYYMKPKFYFRYYALYAMIIYIPIFLWLHNNVAPDESYPVKEFLCIFCYYLLSVFCFTIPFYLWYSANDFLLYQDKLSYINSFINYKRKDVKYEDIKELILKKGLIQRLFGLGTISMQTNANIDKAGIDFFNLSNPIEIYELIQERIAQHKK